MTFNKGLWPDTKGLACGQHFSLTFKSQSVGVTLPLANRACLRVGSTLDKDNEAHKTLFIIMSLCIHQCNAKPI